MKKAFTLVLALMLLFTAAAVRIPATAFAAAETETRLEVPVGYSEHDYLAVASFLEIEDENGVKNGTKLSPNYDGSDPTTWSLGKTGNRISWTRGASGLYELSSFAAGTAYERDSDL